MTIEQQWRELRETIRAHIAKHGRCIQAVGATEGDVQRQFLIEAVVMSLIGGAVGIAVGVAASLLIASTAGWPILISGGAIAGAAAIAMAIGIFFGYYPALKASLLDPIEALRYE